MSRTNFDYQATQHINVSHRSIAFLRYELRIGKESVAFTGHLPDNAFWKDLERRHDINPIRFDHYHRVVGPLIETSEAFRPPIINPVVNPVVNPVTIVPHIPIPPSVPEPATFLLLGLGVIFVLLYRRRFAKSNETN